MAERLTIKNSDGTYSQPTDTTFEKVFNKLAQLEDILEDYDIDSVEELDEMLDDNQYLKEAFSKLHASYQQLETDRDIWIKAYEIALKESGTWWKYDGESNANAMELYYLKAKEFIKNKKSKYRKNE